MKTTINFTISVEVETEDTVADFLRHHGASNFEFHTREKLVKQLEKAVSDQCCEQHAELYADRKTLRDTYEEAKAMVEWNSKKQKYDIMPTYDRDRAIKLREIALNIIKKHDAMEDWRSYELGFEAVINAK